MEFGVTAIFILGYIFIIMEHKIKISRSATAILTGILCWIAIMLSGNKESLQLSLEKSISESSQIIFFLLGAMAIVELIDIHGGFSIVTSKIKQQNKKKLLWIITFITFFLSSILDNLTTTIALIILIRKMISDPKERALFGGIVVIAANAGGAWTVIGDITTTMLWIGGNLSIFAVMKNLFFPSILSVVIPTFIVSRKLKENVAAPAAMENEQNGVRSKDKIIIFCAGVISLIMVPVFKTVTSLPPFMGILFALAVMWIITEIIHKNDGSINREKLSVTQAIKESDIASILFFMGILLAISALSAAGILDKIGFFLDKNIQNKNSIAVIIGAASSLIGNVSLVAASIKMYPISVVMPDSHFWNLLAFSTGTGGSIFIIGSAAGIALMGLEKITFNWYLKNISFLAFIGFISGIAVYFLQTLIFR